MWCDTAHQEPAKVTVLQSATYSCEKIPWHFLNKSRVLVPVFWLPSIFQCVSFNHEYFLHFISEMIFRLCNSHNIFPLTYILVMATQTILGVYELSQEKFCSALELH